MFRLVVIDFDDTLCMTEEACFMLENEAARRMGFPPMSREIHRQTWGKPMEEIITERIPGINGREFMKYHQEVHKEFIEKGLIDAVPEENLAALYYLKATARRIAILTSRSYNEVKHLLHITHPLRQRVEHIYHKDNTAFVKPDPRAFEKVLTDFSVNPAESVYIGDTVNDAVCSAGAGLHFAAVLESGLFKEKDFAGIKVDYFATTFPEAANWAAQY